MFVRGECKGSGQDGAHGCSREATVARLAPGRLRQRNAAFALVAVAAGITADSDFKLHPGRFAPEAGAGA